MNDRHRDEVSKGHSQHADEAFSAQDEEIARRLFDGPTPNGLVQRIHAAVRQNSKTESERITAVAGKPPRFSRGRLLMLTSAMAVAASLVGVAYWRHASGPQALSSETLFAEFPSWANFVHAPTTVWTSNISTLMSTHPLDPAVGLSPRSGAHVDLGAQRNAVAYDLTESSQAPSRETVFFVVSTQERFGVPETPPVAPSYRPVTNRYSAVAWSRPGWLYVLFVSRENGAPSNAFRPLKVTSARRATKAA